MDWPEGKRFAFTVFDDTDHATLQNVGEVYALLRGLGFRTTKSVWPTRGTSTPICGGSTCEDRDYLDWLMGIRANGFEIGYHMNTYHTSRRCETEAGLQKFVELFDAPPRVMANHAGCEENIYWGAARLTGANRFVYNVLTRFRNNGKYRGHIEADPLFWGDLCRDTIKYCRGFVFPEINTLKACPLLPYHDPDRPFVNSWYASSEGPTVDSFVSLLSEAHQDQLEAEGGACIVYTHFAAGFWDQSGLDREFRRLMERLARKNGWFVPVSVLLDYLVEKNGRRVIGPAERTRLERAWLRHKLGTGTS